jgi:DNA-binding transcriptional regulator YiaG
VLFRCHLPVASIFMAKPPYNKSRGKIRFIATRGRDFLQAFRALRPEKGDPAATPIQGASNSGTRHTRNPSCAQITLEKPLAAAGFWSMDIRLPGGYHLAIDWREASGFGLTSDAEHGYGEPADEHFEDFESALIRSVKLIKNRAATVPPYAVRIKELRQKLKLSQEEVASRMGVNQAAVSKLEGREDSRVATLQSYAQALGGRLVLKVVFDDLEEEIQLVGSE